MDARKSLREVPQVDYARLSKGLPPLEPSDTVTDDTDANSSHSEELEPRGDDNTTTGQDNDEQVIASEIAMLQAERIKLQQQKRLRKAYS